MKKGILLSQLILIINFYAISQATGSFQLTVEHNFTQRTIEYYVPNSYNQMNEYPLIIGLHGCGGGQNTAANFRNKLQFLSDSIGAILVCPEGLSSLNGFFGGSDQTMILTTIDTTIGRYNIDTNSVYLTGFSCNGYTTASLGTLELYDWAGIIPFNAALFVNAFTNGSFDFSTQKPICVCIGTADQNFQLNNRFQDSLIANNNQHLYNTMPGIGHTINFSTFDSEILECFNWLDSLKQSTASITDTQDMQNFHFFPNPAKDFLFVTNELNLQVEILVIDMLGKIITRKTSSDNSVLIGTSNIKNGTYIIQVKSKEQLIGHRKLIIAH